MRNTTRERSSGALGDPSSPQQRRGGAASRRRVGPLYPFSDRLAPLYMEDVYVLPGMTLAIAVEAQNGVVLAADSQEMNRPGIAGDRIP